MLHENRGISLAAILDAVAEHLGNTPAIARKSYVHPAVIAAAKGDAAAAAAMPERLPRKGRWMSRTERGLLLFLEAAPSAE